MQRTDYLATGAWSPGQDAGRRQFVSFGERAIALDVGATLRDVTVAYETWGVLNSARTNAILVCNAWTGDSHVAGAAGDGHPTPGWWEGIIGPGLAIDTNEWFVVCSNVLG